MFSQVHHGNGTQSIFYDDPHVLMISIHQVRFVSASLQIVCGLVSMKMCVLPGLCVFDGDARVLMI